ncbi:hypothetical protein GCM10010497_42570 [Streptomyces cinereoruber]|uniref:PE-PGRS family protein n=1 Tax=Streptomyces cinereoruber TaxID=67260 RepID=A0AAV4KRT1_9ACTN|nr:hypothetical protein [Streptomyces cinereoruber]MBB4156527.1 hypothetical protein [Streptomyces cinereoruber]MBY8815635.1 hypothetical protein [Streptomyces cinereoruber]NIH61400.1 hypothetical protein [Streptomyces cinereoruber]QEV32937.1 hypothetical protein CP977_12830 [Streptomyces cinereoruber]GGR35348.1 hypothetical protein GCM10010497_42570 [Streptomyces cinereoruber]
MKPVHPYPTLFGDIELDVLSIAVDGTFPLPYAHVSKTERAVALHQSGREDWEFCTLRLQATLPEAEISTGEWTDVVCLAVLTEKATNARTTTRLRRTPDGVWNGDIDLHRSRYLDRAVLGLTVVATVDGVAGRVIGTTAQDWYLDLKGATPVRQRQIEIVEVDFREGPEEWLRPYRDAPWIVETAGAVPTVYLNKASADGLVDMLSGSGGGPAERMLRDLTSGQIAQDAWTAMFHTAISDLDVDEDGTPVMPTGWREAVLRMMLPDVLPGRQLTDALYDIEERRDKGFGWSELQTTIQYAAGRRSRIAKKLTNAVRAVDAADRSGAR